MTCAATAAYPSTSATTRAMVAHATSSPVRTLPTYDSAVRKSATHGRAHAGCVSPTGRNRSRRNRTRGLGRHAAKNGSSPERFTRYMRADMTSGKRTSESVVLACQRMASYKDQDGHWLLSYEQIAEQLDIDKRVVSEAIREANRAWHKISQWRNEPSE